MTHAQADAQRHARIRLEPTADALFREQAKRKQARIRAERPAIDAHAFEELRNAAFARAAAQVAHI